LHLKLDLHVHSYYSDGLGAIENILEAARNTDLDGLAITDHDTLDGYFRAKGMDSGLLLIPGYEIETKAGHILVLGLEELPPGIDCIVYEDLIGWVKSQGGLTILAHPAISRFHKNAWKRSPPDAIEVLNAAYPLEIFVKRSLSISLHLGLPAVGGSDAHSPITVGDAYSVVEVQEATIKDILRAIKAGQVEFEGGLSSLRSKFRVGVGYLKSLILNA
jgi:predicted metal-dependent phosphoesterase TrpH